MKTLLEWLDENNGYALFIDLHRNPDPANVGAFCDWLIDQEMPGTAEWIRHAVHKDNPHGFWSAMAGELRQHDIELDLNYIRHGGKHYRIIHDRVLVASGKTPNLKKWTPASEKEIREIFPALAVMLFVNTHGSGIEDDLNLKILYGHCHRNLNEARAVAQRAETESNQNDNITRATLREIIRVFGEAREIVAQVSGPRFQMYLENIGEVAGYLGMLTSMTTGPLAIQARQILEELDAHLP